MQYRIHEIVTKWSIYIFSRVLVTDLESKDFYIVNCGGKNSRDPPPPLKRNWAKIQCKFKDLKKFWKYLLSYLDCAIISGKKLKAVLLIYIFSIYLYVYTRGKSPLLFCSPSPIDMLCLLLWLQRTASLNVKHKIVIKIKCASISNHVK